MVHPCTLFPSNNNACDLRAGIPRDALSKTPEALYKMGVGAAHGHPCSRIAVQRVIAVPGDAAIPLPKLWDTGGGGHHDGLVRGATYIVGTVVPVMSTSKSNGPSGNE